MEIIYYRNKLTGLVWESELGSELAKRLESDKDYEKVSKPKKPRRKTPDGPNEDLEPDEDLEGDEGDAGDPEEPEGDS